MDLDSTLAWLNAAVPNVPNYPASDDDSEEEVFFGPRKSHRELHGKNAKVVGRPTLYPAEIASHASTTRTPSLDEEDENNDDQPDDPAENDSLISAKDSSQLDDLENIPPTPGVAPPLSPWFRSKSSSSSPPKKSVSISPLKPETIECETPTASFMSTPSPLKDRSINQISWDRSRSPLNQIGRQNGSKSPSADQPAESDLAEEAVDRLSELPTASPPPRALEMSLNSSTASEWFNNTHDEHILYEKFGDDYDDVVAKMTNPEKRQLKLEIAQQTPKTILELLGEELLAAEMGVNTAEPPAFDESLQIEPEPIGKERDDQPAEPNPRISIKPPTPKPRTLTPQKQQPSQAIEERKKFHKRLSDEVKDFSPRLVQSSAALKLLKEDLALALSPYPSASATKTATEGETLAHKTPKGFYPQDAMITPTVGDSTHHYGTYTKSASSSTYKKPITLAQPADEMFKTPNLVTPQKSASVQRREKMGFNTPSIHRTPSYLRPTSASKHRASPKKDPITREAMDISVCPRHGYATSHQEETDHMACHASQKSAKKLPSSIDMRKIVSPVGEYIKRHPVPPIQRQIKPLVRSNQRAIARAIAAEAEAGNHQSPMDQEPMDRQPMDRQFASLPEAVYKSSRIALEKRVADGVRPGMELPKSFGKVDDVEAMVIRHVGRERVPSNVRLNSQSLQRGSASPALSAVDGLGERGVIRTYDRESVAPLNDSMLEMSIREVKKIYLGEDRPV
ncbi:uncharacterized protein LOC131890929 isoform X2 [Tigriopus californicus]|uniref:uncharacterized protein LOC131890929 isoform X2 n=1 Tax=Tigriopus californicus TaxID=6832 RepID=UPI0027DA5A24|nr:uncharacterized protein LOC131890929 isoform X2 [Tigriopus californicus]